MINNSAHRDLKPLNVLFAEDNNEYRVVLADFGISKYIKLDINTTVSAFTFNPVGTIGWSAPEAAVQSENAAVPSSEAAIPSAEAAASSEREIRIYSLLNRKRCFVC